MKVIHIHRFRKYLLQGLTHPLLGEGEVDDSWTVWTEDFSRSVSKLVPILSFSDKIVNSDPKIF